MVISNETEWASREIIEDVDMLAATFPDGQYSNDDHSAVSSLSGLA